MRLRLSQEFNRRFRHELCVELVRQKLDTAAGDVLAVMLQLSRPHETRLREDRSAPLAEDAIAAAVAKSTASGQARLSNAAVSGASRPAAHSRARCRLTRLALRRRAPPPGRRHVRGACALKHRAAPSTPDAEAHRPPARAQLVTCVGEVHGRASYCVNMSRIIGLIRMREVDAVVRERFGGPACRIFRLLMLKRQLEQKQIAEMAMIPVKDTRELLYRLTKVEFVQLQEVARTADHAPSRTFYLWNVDLRRVNDRLCSELHCTVARVRARLLHEVEREADTMARLEALTAGTSADGHAAVSLNDDQRARLRRVRQVAAALEVSLMRLDRLQLLFRDV